MKVRKFILVLVLPVSLAISIATWFRLSASTAQLACDNLMDKELLTMPYYETTFIWSLNHYVAPLQRAMINPGWSVAYDDGFGVAPFELYVDMSGKVVGGTPSPLMERLTHKKSKRDTKGQRKK